MLISLFFVVSPVYASDITVLVNGNQIQFDQEPVLEDGRVFVPVRAVAEALGGIVTYFGDSDNENHAEVVILLSELKKDCYIYFKTSKVSVWSRNPSGYAEVYTRPLEQKPKIINGRTLIGLRNLAEVLYSDVEWIEETRTVVITSKPHDISEIQVNATEPEKTVTVNEPPPSSIENQTLTVEEKEAEYRKKQEEFELEIVRLVNEERKKHGLNEVEINPKLMEVARIKAEEMADLDYHSHESKTLGLEHTEYVQYFGIECQYAGENIQAGFNVPSSVVASWMKSTMGHREHILNPKLTHIGVGYGFSKDSAYGDFWSLFMTY